MQPPSPPPPQYQPPYGQTARSGWGRFWLGVLAGGCGLLVAEGLAFVVLTVVFGLAIGSVVRQAGEGGGLPGLPGGLPSGLSAGLPGTSQRSDPCSPQPCMAHSGVTVYVANVNRSAGPASDAGSHLVRMDLTFAVGSGTHTVTPEEVAIRDSAGGMTLAGADDTAARCGAAAEAQDLSAGQKAGPFTVCYAVAGSATAPLTLVWISPEDLSIVELKLP